MKRKTNAQLDYTAYEVGYQLKISLECDVRVLKEDPVRLLSAIMDRIDYRRVNMAYSRLGRSEYPARLLMKEWTYGYMRRMIHSREVEAACRENVKFMYLLEGHKAPDHNTLARFRSRVLCVNRSIQAEGTFAFTKEGLNYRRFLCRGKPKVSAEWSLLSIAANILKLHHKLKNDRLGTNVI